MVGNPRHQEKYKLLVGDRMKWERAWEIHLVPFSTFPVVCFIGWCCRDEEAILTTICIARWQRVFHFKLLDFGSANVNTMTHLKIRL